MNAQLGNNSKDRLASLENEIRATQTTNQAQRPTGIGIGVTSAIVDSEKEPNKPNLSQVNGASRTDLHANPHGQSKSTLER